VAAAARTGGAPGSGGAVLPLLLARRLARVMADLNLVDELGRQRALAAGAAVPAARAAAGRGRG
jgi:hypothetical protein